MTPGQQQTQPTGLEIAVQWGQLPPEHLRAALKALEPQLAREHAYRMACLKAEMQSEKDRRAHVLRMTGLVAGLAMAVGMLAAAVVLGVNGQPWLAAALSGPSVIVLVKIFVLGHVGADDVKQLMKGSNSQMPAPPQPAPEPTPGSPPFV
ncbi:hypothetical protein ABZ470_26440 [Streptosporangium sp. NPDC020072]|uniref:hypothetical protein n=1 Tax=Streptosporangium sp. NPDC020072 TaxID=3154788 RepID=UPI00343B8FF0